MERNDFDNLLKEGFEYLNKQYSVTLLDQLWDYMWYLIEENKKYNLTAIEEPHEIVQKHFFDSLALIKEVNLLAKDRVIDVGTGAGFPGMVLKLFQPEVKITLLDSLSKRIGFLNELINHFKLTETEAIHGRAEDLGNDEKHRETFDWVLSRAVAPVNILSEYTIPFSRPGGTTVFYKGPDYQKELKIGKKAIQILGGEITDIKKIDLLKEERYLIFIKKTKKTPVQYPRKAGIPKKRPL